MMLKSFDVALQKGEIAEQYVKDILEKRGYIVYRPVTDKAHAFDMLCIKDKKRAIALDVKAKARLNKWPATGVNEKHYQVYKAFSEAHNMPFYLVFVDEQMKKVYGHEIKYLDQKRVVDGKTYPFHIGKNKNIRVWPISAMYLFGDLDEICAESLRSMSQRGYSYEPKGQN